jgi:cob(I)alamin adenosyltransferase
MVVLNKIYTRTGDKGDTALGSGDRVAKSDLRIQSYGTIDETNATVGMARLHTEGELDAMLGRIQNDLFDLGADLSTPDPELVGKPKLDWQALRITDKQVERLEAEIDQLNANLAPLRSFVLPGGSAASAYLHLSRTISRRAERLMVELAASEPVSDPAMKFINRLSDFFFVAGRVVNDNGAKDVLWEPGLNT